MGIRVLGVLVSEERESLYPIVESGARGLELRVVVQVSRERLLGTKGRGVVEAFGQGRPVELG